MTFLSLHIPSLSFIYFFFFYYPSLFHIGDCLRVTSRSLLAVARFKFSLAYAKIYLDRVARPFVAFSFSHSLSFSLSRTRSIFLSFCFSTILGRTLDGISSGGDTTFRINRPVGLKPVLESRNGESLARVSFATRSMRNAASDEKEDWLETGIRIRAGRRRHVDVGKSRLTIRGNSLRLPVLLPSFPPPPVRRIFNGKIMRGIYSRELPSLRFVTTTRDEGVGLKQTYQFSFGARL